MATITVKVRRADLARSKALWTAKADQHSPNANRDENGQVFVQLFLDRRSSPATSADSVYSAAFTRDIFTNTRGDIEYTAEIVD